MAVYLKPRTWSRRRPWLPAYVPFLADQYIGYRSIYRALDLPGSDTCKQIDKPHTLFDRQHTPSRRHSTVIHLYSHFLHGPPLPTTVVPIGRLSIMSVPTYYTRHSWLNDTQIAHPDPLRSNSNHKEHIRPDSQVLDPIYNAWPSNASVHPAFRLSAAQRFNHADTARFDDPTLPVIPPKSVLRKSASSDAWRNSGPVDYDIPKVPTRPPLRPTVSFGSVSYCSDMSSVLEEKSLKVEAQKQEEQQQRQSWKSFTCLVCLCLLNFVCALGATSLSAALPVSWSHSILH